MMKILCKYNDPNNVPEDISSDFDYGLILEKEYLVMGIMLNDGDLYYFIDENGKPGFYPQSLFEITDSKLSQEWYFKPYSKENEMYVYVQAVWGYYEFVFDQNHYEKLVAREREALELYFKRKIELENSLG